ncbi:GNAT family N-acetyltransferase [Streptomyces sp. NPDC014894]|uniref:GNAT family N-acetyltransferase n=1 Tax=Streptomyces sp. NPDC014894 TaxID=3364931 RepID=UPI0036F73AAC
MISSPPSVIRLAQYTTTELDEITGGVPDPFGVAGTGLTWLPKEAHFGVRDHDRLVAHAGLVRVTVAVGAARSPVAGLGGVVVAPDARGRGLARAVVAAAMAHARDTGAEYGLLFCLPERVPLYEHLGWRLVDGGLDVEQPGGPVRMPLPALWTPLAGGAWPAGRAALLSLPM